MPRDTGNFGGADRPSTLVSLTLADSTLAGDSRSAKKVCGSTSLFLAKHRQLTMIRSRLELETFSVLD